MTWVRGGQPTALAILLAAAACTTSQHVVGSTPEKTPEEPGSHPVRSEADRAEKIRQYDEASAAGGPRVEQPKRDEPRIGVAATHVFHRPDCKLLDGIPDAERVRFTSPWDAVDSRYVPCPDCRPFQ